MPHEEELKPIGQADDAVARLVALIGSEASLQERLAALRARVQEQEAYLDRHRGKAAEVLADMEQLQAKLSDLRVEVTLAERRVEDLTRQASDRDQLVIERFQLESEAKIARAQTQMAMQEAADAQREAAQAKERKAGLLAELTQLTTQRDEAARERAELMTAVEDLRQELSAVRSLQPLNIDEMNVPEFLVAESEKMGSSLPLLDTGAIRHWASESGMEINALIKFMVRAYLPREAYLASIQKQVAALEARVGKVRSARVK